MKRNVGNALENSGYLETYQSTTPNYNNEVQAVEKELNLKKKILELESKLERLLQKSTNNSSENDNERLSALGKKFSVFLLNLH